MFGRKLYELFLSIGILVGIQLTTMVLAEACNAAPSYMWPIEPVLGFVDGQASGMINSLCKHYQKNCLLSTNPLYTTSYSGPLDQHCVNRRILPRLNNWPSLLMNGYILVFYF